MKKKVYKSFGYLLKKRLHKWGLYPPSWISEILTVRRNSSNLKDQQVGYKSEVYKM